MKGIQIILCTVLFLYLMFVSTIVLGASIQIGEDSITIPMQAEVNNSAGVGIDLETGELYTESFDLETTDCTVIQESDGYLVIC
jgi:hypothetical protein